MIRDSVLDAEPVEPAIGKVHLHFTTDYPYFDHLVKPFAVYATGHTADALYGFFTSARARRGLFTAFTAARDIDLKPKELWGYQWPPGIPQVWLLITYILAQFAMR
jgi:hypothetical protein